MSFSNQLWQAIEPTYQKILAHSFIQEFITGTLSQQRFAFYLQQDAIYLQDFARALALAASKAETIPDILTCLEFAKSALTAECELHESFFKQFNIQPVTQKSSGCFAYTNYLLATAANQPFPIITAALLPCFWIYRDVGRHVAKNVKQSHPYQAWIDMYVGLEFDTSVEMAIAMLDRAARSATEKTRQLMLEAFMTSSQLEWAFWDSAYNFC